MRRSNRGDIAPRINRYSAEPTDSRDKKGLRLYKSYHWGVPAKRIIDWKEPGLPDMLVEYGLLSELHMRGGRKFFVREPHDKSCHLAFDPDSEHGRLYILTSANVRREMKRALWNPRAPVYSLASVAKAAGGKQGGGHYPRVAVQVVGQLHKVAYKTEKKGDGYSIYIHTHGDEGGKLPTLCIDASGRLWYAGGDYYSSVAGIAD